MITKTGKVWLGGAGGITRPLTVSQYDTGWTFALSVYIGSALYDPAEAVAVTLEGDKPDGTAFAIPGTFSAGVATFDIPADVSAVSGTVVCELRVSVGNETVGTANFDIIVEAAPLAQHVTSEDNFAAMQALLDEVSQDAASAAQSAASAESAAGTAAQTVLDQTPAMVDAWLEDNIDPATGYALDRSLKVQNAAAPADLVGELKSALNAEEYDSTKAYNFMDIVWHNMSLYSCKSNYQPEAWTAGHWNKISIGERLLSTIRELCTAYDSTKEYPVGSYCRQTGGVYRCIIAIQTGGESWTAGHWEKVTDDMYSELGKRITDAVGRISEAEADIDTIQTGIENINADITGIKKDVISSGGMFPSSYFAQGGINSSGNYVQSTTYRVSTPDTFTVKNDMVITADDGFILTLWLYPSGGAAYNQDGGGFVIPKGTNARVMVRRAIENTSESANVKEFSSALFLTINDFDSKAINKLSYDVICERFEHITYADLLKNKPTLDKRTSAGVFMDYDVLFHESPYSIHMKTLSGDSATSSEIRFTMPTAITLAGTQEFEMCVFIDDATNISNLSLRTLTGGFVKSNYPGIKTGWNKFRFFTEGAGTMTYNTDIVTFRLIVTHSVNTSANLFIGSLVQVKPQYANLIIIADGPYYSFYTEAYPTLKSDGVPVCWAVDGGLLDDNDETDRNLINENELELLAMDGLSEFTFHSYDLTIMSTATANEALADTLKCIRYLKKRGLLPEKIWRGAWLRNSCAHPELADLEVDASCSYEGAAGVVMYPFGDSQYNIPRYSLQSRTSDDFDALFTKMKNHHCTLFCYTHGISTDSDRNMTPTMLAYFISKIETGISEGWLNPTTYNRLVNYYKRLK